MNEAYQDFWFNQNGNEAESATAADIKKELPPNLDYNTVQQILRGSQFYEFYPRTLKQHGEREVQIVESNPINGADHVESEACSFSRVFEQFILRNCNKSC